MVNVFVSHYNPAQAAKALPNLLCQRMCLEAAEILCGAHWNIKLGLETHTPQFKPFDEYPANLPPYKRSLSQRKHPVVLWAGKERGNYVWLLKHMEALAYEHVKRYPHSRLPAPYTDTFEWLSHRKHKIPTEFDEATIQASDLTFYGAFNQKDFLHHSTDIRIQYRLSLLYKWLYEYVRKHSWEPRKPPEWAFDDNLRRILRDIYGKPTTPTAMTTLRM